MIDIHAHILPGIDDGPGEWDKSLKMLRRAAQDGITGIVATPHVVPGGYDNTRVKVVRLVEELKERSRVSELTVYPGSELTLCNETLRGLEGGRYLTINSSRYALVELPLSFEPHIVHDFFFSLRARKFVPVIAHPERNPVVMDDLDLLFEMVEEGALTQVTSGSITGLFGNRVKGVAEEIIARNACHVIASDAHSIGRRAPVLSHAVQAAARLVGEREAFAMVREVPLAIVENRKVEVAEPVRPRKKKFLFF